MLINLAEKKEEKMRKKGKCRQVSDEEWREEEEENSRGERIGCIAIHFFRNHRTSFTPYMDNSDKQEIAKRLIENCQIIVNNPEIVYHIVKFCDELKKN